MLLLKPLFILTLAFAIVLFPVRWIAAWLFAALLHEMCHIIAIKAFGLRIFSITVDITGAAINTEAMHPIQEFICAIAGPLGVLCLLPAAKYFPSLAVCIYLQSCYNMLPLYPLDGGRALYNLFIFLKNETIARKLTILVSVIVSTIFLMIVFFLGLRYQLEHLPVIAGLLIFLRTYKANYSLQRKKTDSTID